MILEKDLLHNITLFNNFQDSQEIIELRITAENNKLKFFYDFRMDTTDDKKLLRNVCQALANTLSNEINLTEAI